MDENNQDYQTISEKNADRFSDEELAKILWDYHHLGTNLEDENGRIQADCLLVCGSNDLDVPRKAAELYTKGEFKRVVISGAKVHKIFEEALNRDGITEAEAFAQIAIERGIPKEAIVLDREAQNTLENVHYSTKLLDYNGDIYHDIILVCCPSHERRALATANKALPKTKIKVTSPDISFEQYIRDEKYQKGRISSLVGHTLRVVLYGKKGDIEKQWIDPVVLNAYRELITRGYAPLRYETIQNECNKYGIDLELENYEQEQLKEQLREKTEADLYNFGSEREGH